ncbi:MAG TPA: phosphoenolpyruvate carboxykinase (ATP), partial [Acidobacteriaceae bacterium]|nr:phosphoenolpyruvate carboxykinase (ATP) [Acidobacteriaceae bacterium]
MLPAEAVVNESPILSQLKPVRIHRNLAVPQMVAVSLARGESKLASNGALVAHTGRCTGRSPKDKFIILDDRTRDTVKWGNVNQPLEPEKFDALYHRVIAYLRDRDVYVQDLLAGADPQYQMPVQIISEYAWQALFVHQLFVRPTPEELATHAPKFTVIAAPEFEAVPERDGTRSSTAILLDFTRKIVLIVGTKYAGEMKKCIFSVLNFLLPQRDVFPMHCSANVGEDGVTALFFGLSGTGKTTLSADPYRRLIGDDEHGWGPNGVFNFEGGCYAKCVDLSKEKEPQIYHAIR